MPLKIHKGKSPKKSGPAGFKRLTELGDEKLGIINSMFYEGKPVGDIMSVLQDGWGLFKDIKTETLKKFLYRYKWEVIDKNLVARQMEVDPEQKKIIEEHIAGTIDVMEEVAQLIVAQKKRVRKLMDREKDMPMLFNSLGGEMKTLAGFVGQYAELGFDLGTLKRIPKVTKITDKDGATTMIESQGSEHIKYTKEQAKQMEDAAAAFFEVMRVVEDDGTQSL